MTIVKSALAFAVAAIAASAVAFAGVQNFIGEGKSQTEACSQAKFDAERSIWQQYQVKVDSFSPCQCSLKQDAKTWACAVDATFTEPAQ